VIKGEGDITLDRPIEMVWKFMTDFENYPTWHKGMFEAKQDFRGSNGCGDDRGSSG
jgi:uncharacterized membrane protein